MHWHVLFQVGARRKFMAAHLTNIRLNTCMHSHMPDQIADLNVLFGLIILLVKMISSNCRHCKYRVSSGRELFYAYKERSIKRRWLCIGDYNDFIIIIRTRVGFLTIQKASLLCAFWHALWVSLNTKIDFRKFRMYVVRMMSNPRRF